MRGVIEPEARISTSGLRSPRSTSLLPSVLAASYVSAPIPPANGCPCSLPYVPLSFIILYFSMPMLPSSGIISIYLQGYYKKQKCLK